MERVQCDILILGSGGAGLFAAHHAYDSNSKLKIIVAAKGLVGKSGCTRMVQGGYNVVLNPNDSIDMHFKDTLKGGGMINNQELAWTLVSDAPKRIRELETKMGCFFDRNPDGTVHQKAFAGQSFDRTVHRGDLTGIEIINRLRDQLYAKESVICWDEVRAVELLYNDNLSAIAGCLMLNLRNGKFIVVESLAVIIGTGGGASMYKIAAPSLEKAADGMAMAYRAGANFIDMEMMQFHPTGLLAENSRLNGGVLEEGLRGAGGHLYNSLGERFMQNYDPEKMERSTRDRVARAAYMEIMAGRGTRLGGIQVSVAHLGRENVLRMFPGMVDRCKDVGRDLSMEPVDVSPTGHFHMGGVTIDKDCFSGIPGLFVAGEDAGGIHGSNRLGGNGVADSTVFGARAGDAAAEYVTTVKRQQVSESQVDQFVHQLIQPFKREKGENPFQLRKEVSDLMWEKVGLVRNGPNLKAAIEKLAEYAERVNQISVAGVRDYNLAWHEVLNVKNIVQIGQMIAIASYSRTESRGSHYRTDCPVTDNVNWYKNIFIKQGQKGPETEIHPVEFTHVQPEEIFGEVARVKVAAS
ncbi:FAD-binding protein [Paenibacillus sp. V4I5]|uniref:FAD-binding protein n=1 Tax=Paenibacillus sp. V4I5 TaxID=3042306 RepID=UPI00278CE6DD|nr:FAD-binding protein [Paenibacillus sp. V4I5]MDQ0920203.1 succinate dehydrogenase/fumarate reductase flavoprotein subunit [Paenibacillus sp. V4I5]